MSPLTLVDVETGRAARGPRLVVAGSLPSPWSEAAKGIFHVFGWCSRLLLTDGGLTSGGARSFPLPVAQYLAGKYSYAPAQIPAALARMREILALFDAELVQSNAAGHRYLMGAQPTALDIYLATFLTYTLPLAEADCPQMLPRLRPAFAYLVEQIGSEIPPALIAHRAHLFETHLPWPIVLRAES